MICCWVMHRVIYRTMVSKMRQRVDPYIPIHVRVCRRSMVDSFDCVSCFIAARRQSCMPNAPSTRLSVIIAEFRVIRVRTFSILATVWNSGARAIICSIRNSSPRRPIQLGNCLPCHTPSHSAFAEAGLLQHTVAPI